MKNIFEFSMPRFLLILKHDIYKNWKRVLMTVGAGFLVILFFAFINYQGNSIHFLRFESHTAFYPLLMMGLGIVLVSRSFIDLSPDAERINYLSLPASHLEKYLSRVFLFGIVLPVIVSLLYCVYAYIQDSFMISRYGSGDNFERFSFFSNQFKFHGAPTSWELLKLYFSVQSLTFLGALTFRKNHIAKTIFSSFFITLLIAGIVFFLFKMIVPELFEGWKVTISHDTEMLPNQYFRDAMEHGPFLDVLYFLGLVVVPLVIMLAAFFKLTEKEA